MLRARQPNQKQQRKLAILDAAWHLLDGPMEQLPSVAAVAKQAGLAKGTIYLYFQTREEIFLALLAEQFHQWLSEIETVTETKEPGLGLLAQRIVGFLDERPKFGFLASAGNAILEQNVDVAVVMAFKRRLAERIRAVGTRLEKAFGMLAPGQGAALLIEAYAVVLGVWQVAQPPVAVKSMLVEEGLQIFLADFQSQAESMLMRLWHGTVALNEINFN